MSPIQCSFYSSPKPHQCAIKRSFKRLALSVFVVLAAAVFTPAIKAATITVTGLGDTLNNDGVCTIREGIINANNDAATWTDCAAGSWNDVINLPAGTITFTIPNSPNSFANENLSVTGDLDVLTSMTINGHPSGTIFDIDLSSTSLEPHLDEVPVLSVEGSPVELKAQAYSNRRLVFESGRNSMIYSVEGANSLRGEDFSVKEYNEFHSVLHPLEHEALPKNDMATIRRRASELIKLGEAIVKLGVPSGTKSESVESFKKELAKFKEALAKYGSDAESGSDADLKKSYSAVHDSFEELAGMLPRK